MRRTATSRWLTAPPFFAFPTTAAAEQLSLRGSHYEKDRIKGVGTSSGRRNHTFIAVGIMWIRSERKAYLYDRQSETATLYLKKDFTDCITPVGRLGYSTSTSITSLRDACRGGPRNDHSIHIFCVMHFLSDDTRYWGGERRL